jgi:hypothetical protein
VTDAELLVASRHDPAAFRELYDRWAERLLAYFYRRVFDPEVAADLLAETFAVAFERRHLLAVAAALLLLGGTLAAAELLNDPEKLTTGSIGCYQDAAMRGTVAIIWPGDQTPVEACAEALREAGQPVPRLVACAYNGAVAVLPGRDQAVCQRQALEPLPPGYTPALGKVAELERAILAIVRGADCLPPPVLAGRVQRLLDRSGWTGWTTWLRLDVSPGPCGSVSGVGGDGRRSIAGALDEAGHRVMVFGAPPRSTEDLLSGPGKLVQTLMDESGERCYAPDELAGHVRRRVAAAAPGRSVTVETRIEGTADLFDARGARLEAGCAVVGIVGPAGNGRDLIVTIVRKR